MSSEQQEFWRKCSSCKKPIGFQTKYYVCSVSTCNGLRTGYVFCSVECWDAHVPGAGHRSAGAIEKKSPAAAGAAAVSSAQPAPARRIVVSAAAPGVQKFSTPNVPRDILIVASKLKDYIKARADFNTSGDVMTILSDRVRQLCDNAIDKARSEGRKTVMDRDFDEL